MSTDNIFHQHLDVCTQCANNPWGLCPEGEEALKQAVENSGSRIEVVLGLEPTEPLARP